MEDPYDKMLLDQVHPPGWVNPEPAPRYNLVVVGAGTAGLVSAAGAAALGARVALIEQNLLGGDCLNAGCVPSKALIRAARAIYDAKGSSRFGIVGAEGARIAFGTVMERMRQVRAELAVRDSARRFRDELGVDVFIGHGRFMGEDSISVGERILFFEKGAVCTGAKAVAPSIPGLGEAGFLTNENVFSIAELPSSLAVIGAGPLGCELAQCFARLGSRVTLIEGRDRVLPREDDDTAELLRRVFVREGMSVLSETTVRQVTRRGDERVLLLDHHGGRRELVVDAILVGVGRAPNLDGLDLEKAGIAHDRTGIKVTDTLMTSNRRVYAAGDVCSQYKFTHAADAFARILVRNALFPGSTKTSALTIPWCTYTDPEIAHVGMYAREAVDKGMDVITYTVPLADVDRAVIEGDTEGFARVHLKKRSGRILGATVVARHAGEIIGEFALAVSNRLSIADLGRTIHPYPTHGEVARKLADAYDRTRFTPLLRKVVDRWMKWQRSGK